MSLGMVLGLGPGDFVLDGDPAPLPQKGAEPPPQFSAHFDLCNIVFNMDPATPEKWANPLPPNFWPMSIVAKWPDG